MTITAVTPVPPRITQDIQDNGARNLRLFLENVRERLNAIQSQANANATNITVIQNGSTTSTMSSDSIVFAIALGGP